MTYATDSAAHAPGRAVGPTQPTRDEVVTTICRAAPQGVRCGATPAPYDVTFPNCPYCLLHGRPVCKGHPVCNEHATTLRAGMCSVHLPDTLFHGTEVNPSRVQLVRRHAGARK